MTTGQILPSANEGPSPLFLISVATPNYGNQEANRLVSRADAARFLNVSVSTLERWSIGGSGPQFIKIGPRKVGYPMRELLRFIETQRAKHAA